MTLDEALVSVADCFDCQDGPATALGPGGEAYVTIVSGGVKPEGERLPQLYHSPEEAIFAWHEAVYAYASGRSLELTLRAGASLGGAACRASRSRPFLYWRSRPELEISTYETDPVSLRRIAYERPVYTVYSRLLITAAPPLERAA
jgi:hypothetical protein